MSASAIILHPFTHARGRRGLPLALAVGPITVAIGVMATLVPVLPASAAPVIFDTPGTHSSVVPAGMTGATIDVFGAQGGIGFFGGVAGGLGGRATATIPVTPGETLEVNVGGAGGDGGNGFPAAGGFNGGGAGGSGDFGGGGGGGASDVRRGSGRLIVAGGGGGSGGRGSNNGGGGGGGGGSTGAAGRGGEGCASVGGGGGGTQSEGGAGGSPDGISGAVAGGAGSSGTGGPGGASESGAAGGGGGGGYFGGGGGGGTFCDPGGGGGGGSGFGPASVVFQTGVKIGDGSVSITYFGLESNHDEGTLDLVKTAPATTTHGAGVTYDYTLTYTPGADGSPATGVVVADDRCSPVTRGPDTPGDDDALLEAGETWTFSCTYAVGAHSDGEEDPIVNTATASANDLDGDPVTGDTDDESVDIIHPADLSLTKADSPDPVKVGGVITFTITVTNGGPGPATDVTVEDELPSSVDFQSASSSQGTCTHSAGTVTCSLGSMAAETATVTIEVVPRSKGIITNTATVSALEPDPDPGNNTDSETTEVQGAAACDKPGGSHAKKCRP